MAEACLHAFSTATALDHIDFCPRTTTRGPRCDDLPEGFECLMWWRWPVGLCVAVCQEEKRGVTMEFERREKAEEEALAKLGRVKKKDKVGGGGGGRV